MWKQLYERSARHGASRQAQVRQMLVSGILDGQLPRGTSLPSSRDMADQLGLARSTVVLAYRQLVDEGYLQARERSGHVVRGDAVAAGVPAPAPHSGATAAIPGWDTRLRFRPSEQRNIVKRADWQEYAYPFVYGQFDAALFPTADWRECCTRALSVLDIRDWAQDMILHDDASLVQQICARVLPRRGVWASRDEVLVTVGAQQALFLLADLLLGPAATVGVEDPGYADARNIFASRSARLRPLRVDERGLVVDDALRGCDYVYVTPSHQCPTTVTMPLERRNALLALAAAADLIVIEDDYESENRFDGPPTPALKSLDRDGRVIYVGSLSKAFAPGLRMGYVVAPAELIAELRAARRLMLRHPAAYLQRAFALFLALGQHDTLLRRLSAAYRERAATLGAALSRHLPAFHAVPISGGASCWVQGPATLDARALAAAAERRGVLIEPGDVFFMADAPPRNTFRLGYSSIAADRIESGVRELAAACEELRRSN